MKKFKPMTREQHPLWPLLVMAENGIHEPHRPACAVPVSQDRICPVSELDLRLFPIWCSPQQLRRPRWCRAAAIWWSGDTDQ